MAKRFVIAESFHRIHRRAGAGTRVPPLQFKDGQSAASLGLTGRESFSVRGLSAGIAPRQDATVVARADDGREVTFTVTVRIDTAAEVDYCRHGGVLPMVLRQMLG